MVKEYGHLEAVAATTLVAGYGGGVHVERIDCVDMSLAVVQPEVFVGDGGDGVDVELGEEVEVCGDIAGGTVGVEGLGEADVGEE